MCWLDHKSLDAQRSNRICMSTVDIGGFDSIFHDEVDGRTKIIVTYTKHARQKQPKLIIISLIVLIVDHRNVHSFLFNLFILRPSLHELFIL